MGERPVTKEENAVFIAALKRSCAPLIGWTCAGCGQKQGRGSRPYDGAGKDHEAYCFHCIQEN